MTRPMEFNPVDPRALANHILDQCASRGADVTNLKLQKLMYFCHADFLKRNGLPLITTEFQAWQFGPVNKLVYSIFKHFDRSPITERAHKTDIESGRQAVCFVEFPDWVKEQINNCILLYENVTTSHLVAMSHTSGGPWHRVWEVEKDQVNLGLVISNELIKLHHDPDSHN